MGYPGFEVEGDQKILKGLYSRPSKFHGFWAVMDQKMAQSWSKIIKGQGISIINRSLVKKE